MQVGTGVRGKQWFELQGAENTPYQTIQWKDGNATVKYNAIKQRLDKKIEMFMIQFRKLANQFTNLKQYTVLTWKTLLPQKQQFEAHLESSV